MRKYIKSSLFANTSPASKEVQQYAEALKKGFALVKQHGLLTNNYLLQIQAVVEQSSAGYRKLPGTKLLNDKTGEVIHTPPQDAGEIESLMANLETFINDDSIMDADPLVNLPYAHMRRPSACDAAITATSLIIVVWENRSSRLRQDSDMGRRMLCDGLMETAACTYW